MPMRKTRAGLPIIAQQYDAPGLMQDGQPNRPHARIATARQGDMLRFRNVIVAVPLSSKALHDILAVNRPPSAIHPKDCISPERPLIRRIGDDYPTARRCYSPIPDNLAISDR